MKELLLKILDLSYEISNTTNIDVFFKYYPHVNTFEVHYYQDRWSEGKVPKYIASSKRINKENLEKAIEQLEELKKESSEII